MVITDHGGGADGDAHHSLHHNDTSLLLLILIDRLMMEAAQRRRLSVIASHLRPISIPPTTADGLSSIVSPSHCNSSDSSKLETDCVFCKIIRGEAPALKVYGFRIRV